MEAKLEPTRASWAYRGYFFTIQLENPWTRASLSDDTRAGEALGLKRLKRSSRIHYTAIPQANKIVLSGHKYFL